MTMKSISTRKASINSEIKKTVTASQPAPFRTDAEGEPLSFWRLPEVMANTRLPRASIYAKMAADEFPHSVDLGERAVAWVASEVQDWMRERIRKRDEADAPSRKLPQALRERNRTGTVRG